mmetsp:Transcript_30762/g.54490  ORF Transcript_30762/g.54490 Transcript_30762/m.54490 type:complete len:126 (+) Transcript_30762:26-403(+)
MALLARRGSAGPARALMAIAAIAFAMWVVSSSAFSGPGVPRSNDERRALRLGDERGQKRKELPSEVEEVPEGQLLLFASIFLCGAWLYIGRYLYECVYLTGGYNVVGGFCAWETRWWLEDALRGV